MNEAKVLDMKQEKKPRTQRVRIESVTPTDIVEVWRLVERSIRDGGQSYPDTTEDSPEIIRSHLFQYLQAPFFTGLIARVGKRPVGIVLGHVAMRPFGRPSRYAFVHCIWIDPTQRKQGAGKLLWAEYANRMKRAGIHHFECLATDQLTAQLTREEGFPMKRVLSVLGGRL